MNIAVRTDPSSDADHVDDPSGKLVGPAHCARLEHEPSELRDRWMRSESEAANVRTLARRDVEEAKQYAIQSSIKDAGEAADTLLRSVATLPPRSGREPEFVTKPRDGFSGIERCVAGLLERYGVTRHDPAGVAFAPALHPAMNQRVSADHPPGSVLPAWTSAWMLDRRLPRPAMVVVPTSPHTSPPTVHHGPRA